MPSLQAGQGKRLNELLISGNCNVRNSFALRTAQIRV